MARKGNLVTGSARANSLGGLGTSSSSFPRRCGRIPKSPYHCQWTRGTHQRAIRQYRIHANSLHASIRQLYRACRPLQRQRYMSHQFDSWRNEPCTFTSFPFHMLMGIGFLRVYLYSTGTSRRHDSQWIRWSRSIVERKYHCQSMEYRGIGTSDWGCNYNVGRATSHQSRQII